MQTATTIKIEKYILKKICSSSERFKKKKNLEKIKNNKKKEI